MFIGDRVRGLRVEGVKGALLHVLRVLDLF